ncbi:MAG: YitT family protein [Treponema sp.]|nr:YitT family protein [Treponema sp.]
MRLLQEPERSPVVRLLLISTGAVLQAINLNTFIHAGGLYPGGITGLSILVQDIIALKTNVIVPFGVINMVLNILPILIGFLFIGKRFTLYSCVMIVLVSSLADVIPGASITDDILLSAVFGGILNAISVSFCLLAGATSGGTDFVAVFISERFGHDAWNYILVFNIAVLITAGCISGWPQALYSIIFQYVSTQMLQVLYRRYQKVTLFIITNEPETIYHIIRDETHHDATKLPGIGCYKETERTILYSIISADEARKVIRLVRKADPLAFINIVKSEQILGRFYNKPKD